MSKSKTDKQEAAAPPVPPQSPELQDNGPTIEAFVAAGYSANDYPPSGYKEVSSASLDVFKATGKMPAAEPAVSFTETAPETAAVEVVPADVLVEVVPRKTIGNTRIGGRWLNIEAGKKLKVPRSMIAHLKEHGIL